jgi:hypothetical protein
MNDAYFKKLYRLVIVRRMKRHEAFKKRILEDFKRKQINTMHKRLGKSYSMLFKPTFKKL